MAPCDHAKTHSNLAAYLNAALGTIRWCLSDAPLKIHFVIKVTVNRELTILLTNLSIDANSLIAFLSVNAVQ